MMVRIDLDGNPLGHGFPYRASSERFVHCEVLRERPDFNTVIHTHAPLATVLGLAGIPFLPISTDSAFLGEITRVPFINPGTTDLGKAVAKAMGNSFAVIMQNHGLVVGGKNLRQAADITLIIESTAKKILLSYMAGKHPLQLPPEAIEEFRKELHV
jgi:ribulose-5-phosphate 4-epimerase/fuculose-1-phosphate aldolase